MHSCMSQVGINFRSGHEGRSANSQFRAVLVHNQGFHFEPPLSGPPPQFVGRALPFLERAMDDVLARRKACVQALRRAARLCSVLASSRAGVALLDAAPCNLFEGQVLIAAFAGPQRA